MNKVKSQFRDSSRPAALLLEDYIVTGLFNFPISQAQLGGKLPVIFMENELNLIQISNDKNLESWEPIFHF